MNFIFAEHINSELENLEFQNAIKIAEAKLGKIPKTEFHEVLGNSFTNPIEDLVNWIDGFYKDVSKKIDIKALYFEMNEFDINTDAWYINGFAYEKDGGLDLEDMDWLSDWKRDTATTEEFILQGFENLQHSFENIEEKEENGEWTDEMQEARDWCEQIVISRFMEFMAKAHATAQQRKLSWGNVPMYFTEHAYDFVVKSNP